MEISFAFGSFIALLAACAIASRRRTLRPLPSAHAQRPGEAGFLRRLAS